MKDKVTFKSSIGNLNTKLSTKSTDMSVEEILQFFGEFYRASGYRNELDINIKGTFGGDVNVIIEGSKL